jgi:uncharacterized small protein (DUF1192 family)
MTDVQLRYHQLLEDQRHNKAQEENWQGQLMESQRANMAKEYLSRYSTEAQMRNVDEQVESSQYIAELQSETARLNAQLSAQTSRYATDVQAATSREVAQLQSETSRYNTDENNATQRARLEFEQRTQAFKNALESQYYTLEKMKAYASTEQTQAKTEQIIQDTKNSLTRLALDARRLNMDEEAQKYVNTLNEIRAWESTTKSIDNVATTINKVVGFLKEISKF